MAFLGTKIKLLQQASQAEEWRKYREKGSFVKKCSTSVRQSLCIFMPRKAVYTAKGLVPQGG
ncbi:hypothetical protein BM1_10855 [Bipolaris maydis]|nr:hypothetical protein BM1_10855 [Bipolaris maydis]